MNIEYLGSSAEQLVAQEFISYSLPTRQSQLFYWHCENGSSNAEVDFITVQNKKIIPVEIKARVKGGMKSLRIFLQKHPNSPYGLKISECIYSRQDQLVEIPLYAVGTISDHQPFF